MDSGSDLDGVVSAASSAAAAADQRRSNSTRMNKRLDRYSAAHFYQTPDYESLFVSELAQKQRELASVASAGGAAGDKQLSGSDVGTWAVGMQ